MVSETPPEEGAGQPPGGGQAQGSVHKSREARERSSQADKSVCPERRQDAGDNADRADHGSENYQNLEPEAGVVEQSSATSAERFGFWTMVATVVLAVATLGLALATFDMARSTRQLAGLAKQQARDTQDALTEARRQADAAEIANSAQVTISGVNFPAPVANQDYTASFGIFDTGRAPAVRLQYQAIVSVVPAGVSPAPIEPCKACGRIILFPSSGLQSEGLKISVGISKIAPELVDRIVEKKTAHLLLLVRIDYFDNYKRYHLIQACYGYDPVTKKGGECPEGNDVQ